MADSDVQNEITQFLEKQDIGASASDIAKGIGKNRITVSKYLEIMKAEGLIDKKTVAQANLWQLNKHANKPRVLIVDDEEHIRSLVKLSLESQHYTLVEASNGIEAIERVRQEIPDLILLDLMMPEMDGKEVCNILKRHAKTEKIPIIMLTAKSHSLDKVEGIHIGADDYITKPFDPLELEARVKMILRRTTRLKTLHHSTGLPTIEELMQELSHTKAKIVFVDIKNFRAFNENFGFKQGDEVLELLSRVVKRAVNEHGTDVDFVAHIGGDDFVVLSYGDANELVQHIYKQAHILFDNIKGAKNSVHITMVDSLDVQDDIKKKNIDVIQKKAKHIKDTSR